GARNLQRGLQLGQRLERESPLSEARMRHFQARLLDRLGAVEEEVEVDRARAEARALAPDAAKPPLDRQEPVEQLPRRELGLDRDGPVEEARLVPVADRLGLPQRRDREHLDPVLAGQQLEGLGDLALSIAEVRADAD